MTRDHSETPNAVREAIEAKLAAEDADDPELGTAAASEPPEDIDTPETEDDVAIDTNDADAAEQDDDDDADPDAEKSDAAEPLDAAEAAE